MFTTGVLKDKCVIAKLNVVPNSDVDAYPVLTADYDPFEPYTYPTLGQVFSVELFDCNTQEKFNLTNVTQGQVKVEIPGGNQCVYFNENYTAFEQGRGMKTT